MLSEGIIIRFIMCCMSFQNTHSFICLKITSSVHFSAQDLSHIVSFFEIWTKQPFYHHWVPRHLSVYPSALLTVYVKLNSTAHHSGKRAASSEVIVLDGGGGEGAFVWTGDALLHNEWSALCGPDSFNMGLHASTYKLGGTSCQNRSPKKAQKKISAMANINRFLFFCQVAQTGFGSVLARKIEPTNFFTLCKK